MSVLERDQQGIAAYNSFLAKIWEAEQNELRLRLDALAAEAAHGNNHIRSIDKIELHAESPPTLTLAPHAAPNQPGALRLELSLTGSGSWSLSAQVKLRWGFLKPTVSFEVEGIRIAVSLNFKRSRTSPSKGLAPSPQATLLEGSGSRIQIDEFRIHNLPIHLNLEKTLRGLIKKAVSGALPTFAGAQAIAELGLAAKPPTVTGPSPDMKKMKNRAQTISSLIQKEHLKTAPPYRSLLAAVLAGAEPEDPVVNYTSWEDSAIWTGHYVAAEAFRHAACRAGSKEAALAAANVRSGLNLLQAMIAISGHRGLLARGLLGKHSRYAVTLNTKPNHPVFSGTYRNNDYLSEDHITRDQYAGAFLGVGMAFHWMRDPAIRKLAKGIGLAMADYLVREVFWSPKEVLDPDKTSVTYANAPGQVLAILQLARRLDPAKYDAAFHELAPMSAAAWLFQWLDTLDPHDHYYKYNLEHSMALLLLGLEDDPAARAQVAEGFRTMRRALRYHANAYFNMVELLVFADSPELMSRRKEDIEHETRHLMAAWIERPVVHEPEDFRHDPRIDKVSFPGLDRKKRADAEIIAREAVPVAYRPGGRDFLWQRSPFSLQTGVHNIRPSGVEFILPYWMGRKLGVFSAA